MRSFLQLEKQEKQHVNPSPFNMKTTAEQCRNTVDGSRVGTPPNLKCAEKLGNTADSETLRHRNVNN